MAYKYKLKTTTFIRDEEAGGSNPLTSTSLFFPNKINTIIGRSGSGKTTIAYYKVKDAVDYFLKQDNTPKKILFCTYTNALVNISKEF